MSRESSDTIGGVSKKVSWVPIEWAFKLVVVLGLAGNTYLNFRLNQMSQQMSTGFVTVQRYDADQTARSAKDTTVSQTLLSLDKSLTILIEQQKTQDIQDRVLADHESRIRALEARR